jgi:hypothetical protein
MNVLIDEAYKNFSKAVVVRSAMVALSVFSWDSFVNGVSTGTDVLTGFIAIYSLEFSIDLIINVLVLIQIIFCSSTHSSLMGFWGLGFWGFGASVAYIEQHDDP